MFGGNRSISARVTILCHSRSAVANDKAWRSASLYVPDRLFLCARITRKCCNRFRWFKNFEMVSGRTILRDIRIVVVAVVPPPPKICNFFCWNRCILSFCGWRNLSHIYWCLCGLRGSYPPKCTLLQIWKLCRRDAIRLRLVEMDAWHCQGCLAGTDLVKLS